MAFYFLDSRLRGNDTVSYHFTTSITFTTLYPRLLRRYASRNDKSRVSPCHASRTTRHF